LIDWWKSLKPPGRFLKKNKDSESWFEVEDGNEVRLVVQRMLIRPSSAIVRTADADEIDEGSLSDLD
jgi:hypothetical protein